MSTKLSFSDIVDLFSAKTGQPKKDAESFLRELLEIMSSKICEDGVVKLRDFGTFKIVEVESRESVDVNTGGKIVIAPHRKISFVPDKTLKELVNQPFSLFQPELLNEGVNFDQTLSEKELDELDENEMEDLSEDQPEPILPNEAKFVEKDELPKNELAPSLEPDRALRTESTESVEDVNHIESGSQPIDLIEHKSDEKDDSEVNLEPSANFVTSPVLNTSQQEQDEAEELVEVEAEKKSLKKLWLIAGICLAGLFVVMLVFYFFNTDVDRANPSIQGPIVSQKDTIPAAPKPHVVIVKKDTVSKAKPTPSVADSIDAHPAAVSKKEPTSTQQVVSTKTVTETVTQGASFRTLALKYYGSKDFWGYIYQANKSIVPDPNNLKYGLKISIPDAKSLGINVNDPNSLKKAKQLNNKILNQAK